MHVAVTAALPLKGFALPLPAATPPPSLGDTEDIEPIEPIEPIDPIEPIEPIEPIDIGAMPPMCGFGATPPATPSASFSRCTPDMAPTSCREEEEEAAEEEETEKEALIGATRAAVAARAAGEAPAMWRGAPMSASPVVWFILDADAVRSSRWPDAVVKF